MQRGESSALGERVRGLGERQVLRDCPDLRLVHQSHLAKLALALAGLLLEDVALALFMAQYLARAGYLETLGDCLAGFIDTTFAGHGGRRLQTFSKYASIFYANLFFRRWQMGPS